MDPSVNTRAALVGIGGAAVAFFLFRGTALVASLDPLDAIPAGAFFVASVDVGTVQKSPLFVTLLGEGGATRMLGLGDLAESCGFDPITRVSRLAVAVPEDNAKGEFGLAAKVNVTGPELEKCTKALSHGKSLETKKVGNWIIVESATGARLAYGGGLLLVGRGAWLEQMMAAADKKAPSAKDDPGHSGVRRVMATKLPASTIVVTAVLPKTLRDKLRADMKNEVDPNDESSRVFAGVLGVETAGVAVDTGDTTKIEVELVCDTADSCASVEKLVLAKKTEWLKDIRFRIVGLTPVIESLAVSKNGAHLSASANADAKQLASTMQRVMSFGNRPPPSMSAMPHPIPRDDMKP